MSEIDPTNLCASCVGACCRSDAKLTMALSEQEKENLESVGTVLIEFLPAEEGVDWSDRRYFRTYSPDKRKFIRRAARRLNEGQGIYGLESDCGFLEVTEDGRSLCSAHDNPELKPDVCDSFRSGSRTCFQTRRRVVGIMQEMDSLLPDLVGVAAGEKTLSRE